ncbi:hypothetical protein ES703_20197 [subsurface metagenome]
MGESADKGEEVSIFLTSVYIDALDKLIDDGLFEDRVEIIKDGLRRIFRQYEMKPFVKFFEENGGQ